MKKQLAITLAVILLMIIPFVILTSDSHNTVIEAGAVGTDDSSNTAIETGRVGTSNSRSTVIETGTIGTNGAPWRLYRDGVLIIEAGIIDMTGGIRPWRQINPSRINKIIFTGPITAGPSLRGLFDLSNITIIEGLEYFDTSNVTDMSRMFQMATGLTYLDLSSWDTSNVTNMEAMFFNTRSLTSLDLSNFDTGNVITMSHMFSDARSLSYLNLSSFNTDNVTNMWGMFSRTNSLESLDLSNFNTSNVTSMGEMFEGTGLTSLDLTNFDTSRVTYMCRMFSHSLNLTNLDLSGFDTGNVRSMAGMFLYTSNLTSLNLSGFNTGNVRRMNQMFQNAYSLVSLDLSSFDTSNVGNMHQMFRDAHGLVNLDLSNFDTRRVGNMSQMFQDAHNLSNLNLSGFNTRDVGRMGSIFRGATSLQQLTLGENFYFVQAQGVREPFFNEWGRPVHTCPYSVSHAHLPIGYWQNMSNGTAANPQGEFIFTASQLMATFDGQTMADTWVRISGHKLPFTDMPEGYAMRHAIWYMYENNIMQGTSSTTFAPNEKLSRAMMVTILHRLTDSPSIAFNNAFDDVFAGQWYTDAILWATQNNIVQGIGEGRFVPHGNVTREQLITMLYRFAASNEHNLIIPINFTLISSDANQISDWALESMNWAAYNGFITNLDSIAIRPLDYATRVEVAFILERFLQYVRDMEIRTPVSSIGDNVNIYYCSDNPQRIAMQSIELDSVGDNVDIYYCSDNPQRIAMQSIEWGLVLLFLLTAPIISLFVFFAAKKVYQKIKYE